MKTKESHGIAISLLCTLSGRSRQAYYKQLDQKEQSEVEGGLIIQQVMDYRKIQKRLGTCKVIVVDGSISGAT